ncbi:hypothetical protein [Streptomyces sp. NPDC002215]|uniref:hypothetical protein n=1 Tax=Streptomyces sp. NPDC002215 TaxID=3154412 RepID=UPI0033296611
MAMCKKCGARKRSWPRSCSWCRSGPDRADAAADAAEVAVETGLLGGIGRGITEVARLVLRAFD